MKVLVIGGNGRVGPLLVDKLASPHQVLSGSRNPKPENNLDNIEQVYLDLLSNGKVVLMHDGNTPIDEALNQLQ
ncbi:hypothetical protein [Flavobacterium sp. FlaQc-48]|uniref:hypothetical protein n=1 Tax=Flavobacterium sp. FlaQc-48 TaxID=3374181 RepID=UPI0037584AB7